MATIATFIRMPPEMKDEIKEILNKEGYSYDDQNDRIIGSGNFMDILKKYPDIKQRIIEYNSTVVVTPNISPTAQVVMAAVGMILLARSGNSISLSLSPSPPSSSSPSSSPLSISSSSLSSIDSSPNLLENSDFTPHYNTIKKQKIYSKHSNKNYNNKNYNNKPKKSGYRRELR